MKTFWLIVYFIVLTALVYVGVVFAKDNANFMTVKFFKWNSPQAPLWVFMALSLLGGYLISTMIMSWKLIRLTISRKQYINSYEKLKAIMEKNMDEYKTKEDEN